MQVAEAEGIPIDDMAIYNQGTPLNDDLVISGNVPELSTLTVEARMLGGTFSLLLFTKVTSPKSICNLQSSQQVFLKTKVVFLCFFSMVVFFCCEKYFLVLFFMCFFSFIILVTVKFYNLILQFGGFSGSFQTSF